MLLLYRSLDTQHTKKIDPKYIVWKMSKKKIFATELFKNQP